MVRPSSAHAPAPVSPTQASAIADGQLPAPDRVADGVWSVTMEMPGPHLRYSFCYVIVGSDDSLHVIDPGWGTKENALRLESFLPEIGSDLSQIQSIVVTHLHPDHSGQVEQLRDATGASLMVGADEFTASVAAAAGRDKRWDLGSWGIPAAQLRELSQLEGAKPPLAPTPDVLLADGEELAIPGRHIRAMHTGGHTTGHLCFHDPEASLVFTGDHVLPRIHPGLGLGGKSQENPMAAYLKGLRRTAELDGCEAAPGHEYRFRGLAKRSESMAAHHLRRTKEVADALATNGESTVWEVASRLTWTAGWENLAGFYIASALLQTEMHMDFVRSGAAEAFLGGDSTTG
ncbi:MULTISPECIES: MBL fold metallo-hydrolase [unclassified Salinibacterium]|uniref:MBL fold metallo-hydrolase n=1 Tax=unclassified Salinibacterium TaxID=2632331 RepID=UPI0018CDA45B|nr:MULTISPECIES: MBL fold metallo-hydrolase [unclassified Salinibacterium]MBH0023021.1 MBL fold metallo-hydrolase [Salinibacterium sp. SWN248]MBH0053043.1 MBL fold metallo-hydrolase [Salinibacterium sp. SWN139]MBH0082307.1 MBL fold metallo-hydrolase [Salinibacterium sp. SWN167]